VRSRSAPAFPGPLPSVGGIGGPVQAPLPTIGSVEVPHQMKAPAWHIAGDYPELFGALLARLGIDLVGYDLDEGRFPDSLAECDGWLCSPSRSSTYDDEEWIADAEELHRAVIAEERKYVGICFGHQLLGRAFGGKTFKLTFGHRGGNQPVKDFRDGHVEITSHNHGFAVQADSLPAEVEVTHINLNDQCVEGMRHKTLPIISVQYHPEAAPGPHDAEHHFQRFIDLMESR